MRNNKDNIKGIEKLVCDYLQIDPQKLHVRSRKRELAEARFYIFYLCRDLFPGLPYRELKEYYNLKSHASVKYGEDFVLDLVGFDPKVSKIVKDLLSLHSKGLTYENVDAYKEFLISTISNMNTREDIDSLFTIKKDIDTKSYNKVILKDRNTGEIVATFDSQKDCAERIGISQSAINFYLTDRTPRENSIVHSKGYEVRIGKVTEII